MYKKNKKLKKVQDLLKLNIKYRVCPYCGEIVKKNEETKDFYCECCNTIF